MKLSQPLQNKIFTQTDLEVQLAAWRAEGKKIVFTNGVFDIVHNGHLVLLSKCASLGDVLIIGINSDASVKRLKGENRPVNHQDSRALMLAFMTVSDGVVIFEEDTPENLINIIKPDVLVKGGDYTTATIVGAKETIERGGEVVIVDLESGYSTTATIEKIKKQKELNA